MTSRFNGIFFAIFQFNGFLGTVLASSIQLSVGPEDFARANKILFLVLGVICAAGVVVLFFLKSAPPLSGATTAPALAEPPSSSSPPVSAAILVDNHPASAAPASTSLVESKDGPHSAEFASLEDEPAHGGTNGGAAAESATESHVAPLVAPRELTVASMLRFMATSAPMAGLCPISVYNGLALGFFLSDFPDVYASKLAPERNLLGHDMVGYVTAVYFLVAAIGAMIVHERERLPRSVDLRPLHLQPVRSSPRSVVRSVLRVHQGGAAHRTVRVGGRGVRDACVLPRGRPPLPRRRPPGPAVRGGLRAHLPPQCQLCCGRGGAREPAPRRAPESILLPRGARPRCSHERCVGGTGPQNPLHSPSPSPLSQQPPTRRIPPRVRPSYPSQSSA